MGQLVNIMESPVRRLTFGEMGDSYPKGKSNALGDDAESKAYRSKFIDNGAYKGSDLNPFFAETTRTVDGSPTQILNADDNYRIQCSYFECYSVQDLYRFYIEPNIILASNKLQTQINDINDIINKLADNSNATSSKRTNGLVSKTQWSGTNGAPVLFTSGKGYVAKASTGNLGVVKNGTNTSIGSDGAVNVLTATGGTTNPLGVVKQGDHVTIDSNGRLSANGAGKPTSSSPGSKGVVGIKNGGNINISDGVIEVPKADKDGTTFGVVKIGNNLSINPVTGKLDATDTDTKYPAADDSTPNTLGTVKTGSGSSKGDISWKSGVGTVKLGGIYKPRLIGREAFLKPIYTPIPGSSYNNRRFSQVISADNLWTNDDYKEILTLEDTNSGISASNILDAPSKVIIPVIPASFYISPPTANEDKANGAFFKNTNVRGQVSVARLTLPEELIANVLSKFGHITIEYRFDTVGDRADGHPGNYSEKLPWGAFMFRKSTNGHMADWLPTRFYYRVPLYTTDPSKWVVDYLNINYFENNPNYEHPAYSDKYQSAQDTYNTMTRRFWGDLRTGKWGDKSEGYPDPSIFYSTTLYGDPLGANTPVVPIQPAFIPGSSSNLMSMYYRPSYGISVFCYLPTGNKSGGIHYEVTPILANYEGWSIQKVANSTP